MSKNWRNYGVVSGFTLFSRILGLFRDMILYAVLGTSAVHAGFILAFTFPNLFRRLLGEGALSAAAMPVFASVRVEQGSPGMHGILNSVLRRLFRILLLLCTVVLLVCAILAASFEPGSRFSLAAGYSLIAFPYVIPVCLAAIMTAALQLEGAFAVPALTPVLLNLAIIAGAGLASFLYGTESTVAAGMGAVICGAVLLGGMLQLGATAASLRHHGWKWRTAPPDEAQLNEIRRLFLPGVLGAAVVQINLLATRFLALLLGSAPVTYLYLAGRLVELPTGLFATAVATVAYPRLSEAAARRDDVGFRKQLEESFFLVFALTAAAAGGLAVLAEPIVALLFGWGRFAADDIRASAEILRIYSLALPAYGAGAILLRGLHAFKEMRLPVRIATGNLFLNLILALVLMGPFGVAGLAIANVVSSWVQVWLLWRCLASTLGTTFALPSPAPIVSARRLAAPVVAVMGMIGAVLLLPIGIDSLASDLPDRTKSPLWDALRLAIAIVTGIVTYFSLLALADRNLRGRLCHLLHRDKKKRHPHG